MVQIRRAIREAGEAGSSSTTEARSTALPACSDGFDNIDGGPECGFYIQMHGIEQVCIRSGLERRRSALGVAFVAAKNVGEHFGFAHRVARSLELGGAPPRADLRRSGDENLDVGVRENDRA